MIKNIILLFAFLISVNIYSQVPSNSELVSVNGKNLYYEVYGEGEPLLLLHGYTLSSKSWLPYIEDFASDYEVYLIDLTGHGKSDAFVEDLSLRSVAQDLNLLIQHLELDSINAIGFSFGGDVLYQLALINSSLIKSMITIGAVGSWSINDFLEYKEAFTFANRANFPWLQEAHGSDHKIKSLMEQFANYKIRVSNVELAMIESEVLIMVGDDDEGMDLNEVVRTKNNLPNADLWILPNVAHGAHEGETKDEFVVKAKVFLSKSK